MPPRGRPADGTDLPGLLRRVTRGDAPAALSAARTLQERAASEPGAFEGYVGHVARTVTAAGNEQVRNRLLAALLELVDDDPGRVEPAAPTLRTVLSMDEATGRDELSVALAVLETAVDDGVRLRPPDVAALLTASRVASGSLRERCLLLLGSVAATGGRAGETAAGRLGVALVADSPRDRAVATVSAARAVLEAPRSVGAVDSITPDRLRSNRGLLERERDRETVRTAVARLVGE